AGTGRRRSAHGLAGPGDLSSGTRVGALSPAMAIHIGPADEVITSLQADSTLERATDMTVQCHSIDPPHPFILRSIELVAEKVAPALGWSRSVERGARQVA